jgi:hypothetical protein
MKSRNWIGTVLITLVVLAILATGGYALYRYGYSRGALATHMEEGFMSHDFDDMPFHGGRFGELPRYQQGDLPQRFQDRLGAPYHRYNPGMVPFEGMLLTRTIAWPFLTLLRVLLLGFLVWGIYKIITLFTGGRSWQLSFNSQSDANPEVEEKSVRRGRAK